MGGKFCPPKGSSQREKIAHRGANSFLSQLRREAKLKGIVASPVKVPIHLMTVVLIFMHHYKLAFTSMQI